jgi:hypothetical protein
MLTKYFKTLSSTFLMIALTVAIAAGQTTTGAFIGFVSDAQGAVIRGAKVTAINEQTNFSRTVVTNSSGEYLIPLLPIGRYTLKFEADSFKQRSVKGLALELNQQAKVDVRLEVGQITEVVTSEDNENTPLARTETAEAGEVIENKRIVDLPLNGRLFLQLAQLTPGVVENARGDFGQQLNFTSGPRITVLGARTSDNQFTVDGVSATDRFFNSLTLPISVDALQEFNVRSNLYSAESGTLGGAQINIAIKSGTNDLHGSVYGYLRNDQFDARNFFDTVKPEFRQSQFGGTVGGPVIKDKAFFFGNYEGLRLAKSLTRLFAVPNASLRSGQFTTPIRDPQNCTNPNVLTTCAFFTDNTIPDARISPLAKALLQFVPLPNRAGGPNNFTDSPREINDGNQFTIKTNVRLGEKDEGFVRYSFYDVNAYQPFGFVAFASSAISLPGFGIFIQQRSQNVAISETHIFSPSLIGEFKLGYNRVAGGQVQQNNTINFAQQFNIQGASLDPGDLGLPRITIAPFNAFGDVATTLSRHDNDYQFGGNLSWFLGRNSLTIGSVYKRLQFNPLIPSNKRGAFNFNGMFTGQAFADFLLGLPSNANGGVGSTAVYLRGNEAQAYVQDDIKVSKRLTVNLGLRYEYGSPLAEKYNRWATLDVTNRRVIIASEGGQTYPLQIPGLAQQLAPLPIVTSEDAGINRGLVNRDLNNVAPRAGFAYDLFGNQRTVLRGGYGIYYSPSSFNAVSLQSQAPPFFARLAPRNTLAAQATIQTILTPQLAAPAFQTYDIDYRTPYYQQYNFSVQRLLMRNLIVEAQYVGLQGRKLFTNIWYNTPDASPLPTPTSRSLFPNLANFALQASAASSSYNAGILRVEKRLSSGLAVMGSYTYAKAIDNDSLGNTVVSSGLDQSNNKALERARSSFDIRHRLVVSFTYDLPVKFGSKYFNAVLSNWQVGGIITEQSGLPFTANLSTDRANNGLGIIGYGRPNLVGDPNLSGDQQTVGRFFNTDAFVLQPFGTLGTAGRNILNGPGTNNVDFSLLKSITFTERHRVQFRSEFFNLFNRTNFDFPERICTVPQTSAVAAGASCTGGTFGTLSAARDPRILQFALKYMF